MLKIALAAQASNARDPARVLSGLNEALCGKFQGHYITAAYALIDTAKHTICYAGAGHPPLLLMDHSAGTTLPVTENGLFLGYFPQATYSSVEMPFHEGDWGVLYTDGVVETSDASEEQFGTDRLRLFVEKHHNLPAAALVDRLLDELASWSDRLSGREPEDDITLVALRLNAPESVTL
jgi:serine phosphatase RsbU (regulator of sigma subunit)